MKNYKVLNTEDTRDFLPMSVIGQTFKGKESGTMIKVFIPELNYVLLYNDEVEEVM